MKTIMGRLLIPGGLLLGTMLATPIHAQTYLYIAHAASGRNISATANPAYPIDISIDGNCVVKGLTFGEITGPLSGAAGSYHFVISPANTGSPCASPAVYSVESAPLADGTTYFGIVTLDSSNALIGQIYGADFSSIPIGQSRVMVANATDQNLSASLKDHPGQDHHRCKPNANVDVAADSIAEADAPSGSYEGSIYLSGTDTWEAGPVSTNLQSRDLYFYVLAGSTSNNSVQIIGPKVIKDVF
jgi:uncharacterized protein DUF4397